MSNSLSNGEANGFHHSLYKCLHDIAVQALRQESPGLSIQATMLVNDAYLRLVKQKNVNASDRTQVRAAGAMIIRRLLVDHARKRKAKKRGGPKGRGIGLHIFISDYASDIDMLELNEALDALGARNARAAQVVELKFFGGLSGEEIAEMLGVSLRTVNNDWRFAKAWLYRELGPESDWRDSNE